MSVLIKGMDMPQYCGECPCCSYDDIEEIYRCNYVDDIVPNAINYKLDECPLVEIPTPHGRLIDADKACELYKDEDTFAAELAFRKIQNAPTIIEAEGI